MKKRPRLESIERVVAIIMNPHEQLGTPRDRLRAEFGLGKTSRGSERAYIQWPATLAQQRDFLTDPNKKHKAVYKLQKSEPKG